MTFSFIETPFNESSQLIALPVILYILKDNQSIKTLCSNSQLNMAILLASVFVSKTNFQASVYLMLTFIMLHLLGNCSESSNSVEEFKPLNKDEDFQQAEVSELVNYDLKGSNTRDVYPNSSNQYLIQNNDGNIVEESNNLLMNQQEVSNQPETQTSEMDEVMGFSDDIDNFESF